MDDVSLINALNTIVSNSDDSAKITNTMVTDNINLVTALTEKVDKLSTKDIGTKKTLSDLNTKIGDLGTSSSKTESQLGKLNFTLGGVERLIKSTNELTSKQTKVLEGLDPGSRRLKGDTYDAQTGTEKRLRERARRLESSGMSITKGLVTAGAGLGGYKLLSFLSRNKLPLAMLGLGGGMAPGWMTGDVGFREGLFGPDSWLRKNFAQPGGGGAANWMMDNPWWTLGGAGMVGTSLGRSALWGGTKLGLAGAGWGARQLGGAAKWGLGGGMGQMINSPSRVVGLRNMVNTSGGTGAHGWNRTISPGTNLNPTTPRSRGTGRLKPDSFKNIAKTLKGGPVQRTYLQVTKDAAKRGFTKGMAKRIGALAAARTLQGLALAGGTGGLGTPVTIALWGATIAEIAYIIAEPVGAWWAGSPAEKLIDAREKLEEQSIIARDAGIKITDDKGKFLSAEEVERQNTTGPRGPGRKGLQASMKRRSAKRAWVETLKDKDVKTVQRMDGAKNKLITQIRDLSDGKQFIGKTWSHKELYDNATYEELFGLYHDVVLPRALGKKGEEARRKAGYTGAKAVKGEAGAALKGSKAEISEKRLKVIQDSGKTKEEIEAEKIAAKEAEKAAANQKFNYLGMGGAMTLKDWNKEAEANRALQRQAIEEGSLWRQTYTETEQRENTKWDKRWEEFRVHNQKYMEFLQTPAGQQPGAAHQWLEDNAPPINPSFEQSRRNRR